MIRQGDILLLPVTGVPLNTTEEMIDKDGLVVAEGEATGHHHRLRAVESRGPDRRGERPVRAYRHKDRRFIVVAPEAEGVLTHEEHETLTVPTGTYEVVHQREYEPPKDSDPRSAPRQRRVFD